MTTTAPTVPNAEALLTWSPAELDALFRRSPAGEIPRGRGRGTAILFPGTEVARPIAKVIDVAWWQGKVFDPAGGDLRNLVGPTGVPAFRAVVYAAPSWLDGQPCTVLDYSQGSRVVSWIRDEIREIAPGVFLGLVWGVGRVFMGHRLKGRFALTFPPGG